MKILITGAAGFIGYHLAERLLKNSQNKVFGIDNINDYYDVSLKKKRLKKLKLNKKFYFYKNDICDNKFLQKNFKENKYNLVIHLAAQPGVRQKENEYINPNILGFFNIIENVKINNIKSFIYASSSSVYGDNKKNIAVNEKNSTDNPISFYAATKKFNELIAYTYSKNYKIRTIGLRFFTVYGPFGRPDMSVYKFVDSVIKNKKIEL